MNPMNEQRRLLDPGEALDRQAQPSLPEHSVSKLDLNRLMTMGKKQLAREVFRLQDLMTDIKHAALNKEFVKPRHQHAEAFSIMTYKAEDGETVKVWNSRDGVTPFAFAIGGKRFVHQTRLMTGPVYQQHDDCGYRWESLSDAQAEAAWQRHLVRVKQQELDRAEKDGRPVDGERIARINGALPPSDYQGFDMALRNLTTGELEG